MRRLHHLLAVVLVLTSGAARSGLFAAEGAKVRVLLTTGGHAFEKTQFYAMFDAMSDVQYTKAEMPKEADLLKPGLEKQYDVLVMYDMNPGFTPPQQTAFTDLLGRGIGVVALHHNLGANRKWDEYVKVIGGKYLFNEFTADGKTYPKSSWAHGQELKITVADPEHPITRGIKDFTIHDETYKGFYVSPNVKVLLTTDHPMNNREIAWVTQYGQSPVAYIMLGHDHFAYENPSYAQIIGQAIRWAAKR